MEYGGAQADELLVFAQACGVSGPSIAWHDPIHRPHSGAARPGSACQLSSWPMELVEHVARYQTPLDAASADHAIGSPLTAHYSDYALPTGERASISA